MDYVQVLDGKIVQARLPKTGKLKSGCTVSGYNMLDEEVLRDEDWLPVEEQKPDYDPVKEILNFAGYEIEEDRVIRNYVVVAIPKPSNEPQKVVINMELADAYEAIAALNERLKVLEGGTTE